MLKKGFVVGIIVLLIGVAGPWFLVPGSAYAPQRHSISRLPASRGEWTEQTTGFPENRGIQYICCVNDSVVWATAICGDNPSYPCQDFTVTTDGGVTWTSHFMPEMDQGYFSMICAINATTAWAPMYAYQNGVMGLFVTYDGGMTWQQQTTAAFNLLYSFPDCVHFWDATHGWCMGDPSDNYYEIYTTADGGNTWVRVPSANIPAPLQSEWGYPGCCCVVGQTIWFGTTQGRVYKSVDAGFHWTVAQTTLKAWTKPVFRDALHGLAISLDTAGLTELSETSDGGMTWHKVTYTGHCYGYDLCYIPGTAEMYMSVGASENDSGASYSLDGGHTWTTYDDMVGTKLLCLGFTDGKIGWAGSYNTESFTGGIFKHVPTGPLPPAFGVEITGGRGFTVNVTNVGEVTATNVTVTVDVSGGVFIRPNHFTGESTALQGGENTQVKCAVQGFGLGLITPLPSIDVTVTSSEGATASAGVKATVFFSKVTIR